MSDFDDLASVAHATVLDLQGDDFTYTPMDGAPFTITGRLRSGDDLESEFPEAEHGLWVVLSDFTDDPVRGDQVTISGDSYRIIEIEPVGDGSVWLYLQYVRK